MKTLKRVKLNLIKREKKKTGLWKLVYEKIIHLKAKRKGDSILGYMYKTKLVDGWGGDGGGA